MILRAEAEPVKLCSSAELRRIVSGLDGMRVTLMGLGLFGGGEGAARFFVEREAYLTVTDLRPPGRLGPTLDRLRGLPILYRLGEHVESDFLRAGLVVANPAVRRDNRFLRLAQEAGVPVTSDMDLFRALCPAPIAAVTGSNGKSTTTALLAAMLRSAGRRVWMGGNIGISLLPSLQFIAPTDIVVLELSSFQLEDAAGLPWSPHVAVVTNITPNHLDRHESFEAYAEAKRAIIRFQCTQDFAVLNAHNPVLRTWAEAGVPGSLLFFDSTPGAGELRHGVSLVGDRLVWRNGTRHEVICLRERVPLLGLHNTENAMAAAAAARCLGATSDQIRESLSHFVGLEHRLEFVGEFDGLRFYNDSYSTTPAAGIAAVSSLRSPLTLIAGGYDKKLDITPFACAAARSVAVLITIGKTGPLLAQKVREESARAGRSVVVKEAATLQEAVQAAFSLSMPHSAVLFSPGCASYDMFENYNHRGKVFKELVHVTLGQPRARSQGA
jgi:UDP-N-acetylmuramoylalanine--D-glutamate ligase